MVKKTTAQFIADARTIHGDKYDYSKVEYVNSKQKVIIICPVHGEFLQKPNFHLNGSGCAKCSKCHQHSTQEWIEKAKLIHGDKYDYSKVEYVNSKQKVIIICPVHGEFLQKPASHLSGIGCAKCSGRCQSNTIEFIEKAKLTHGEHYNYSETKYVNGKKKVIIICPAHGEFLQIPNGHLSGQGCPDCANSHTANDTLYIWQADGIYYNGNAVYKVGITSKRLQDIRIKNVAKKHGYKPVNIVMAEIANAQQIEAAIKKMGTTPPIAKIDGHSEFRAFTPDEYYSALSLMSLFAN